MTDDLAKMFAAWMEQGQKMAQAFMPGMESFDAKAMEKFFPAMPKELLEMWFGKTFNPEGLDARTRFLVTIAALTVLGPVGEPQLRLTIKNALSAGATKREIAEVIWQMSMFGGLPATQKALEQAQAVFAEVAEKSEEKDA
jgi:4-carboxymuconolactone decarboxylase